MRERALRGGRALKPLLPLATAIAALAAGACGNKGTLVPQPEVITFQFSNAGADSVFLFQDCLLVYNITQLGDPVRPLARQSACSCDCARTACPASCEADGGSCFQGAVEVALGTPVKSPWTAVNVTYEPRATGSCERQHTLPAGQYRIDVPVYATPPTVEEIEEGTAVARTATQSFELPAPDDSVSVGVGASP